MSQEIDDLVKKSAELRESGRLEEAILSARRATSIDSESANAWWQLALSVAKKDGEGAALEHFKKTVELADEYGFGWHRLGNAYKSVAMMDEAVEAWETACEYNDEFEWTRYNLIDAYNSRDLASEKEKMLAQLVELETQGKLRKYDYHLLAIAHHNKGDYLNAIPYYKKYLSQRFDDEYGYSNLSLAYSSKQVGQDLDAVDCCHLALMVRPEFENATKQLSTLTPKLEKLKANVDQYLANHTLIADSSWFENYVSPFELLQIEEDEDTGELEIKEIQKAKKILLQEIELEDGIVEWMPNLKIDRSRAIKLADELTDETLRYYHAQVYQCKPLLNFLSRGDVSLFLYDKDEVPTGLLSVFVGNEEFARWLSEIFSKQYDALFAAALLSKNIDVIEAILDGRRFVIPEYEDKCFTTGIRYSSDFLTELKVEQEKVEKTKPAIQTIRFVLSNKNLGRILEVLPPAFQEVQAEAAQMIRNISIDIYNHHGDADLAKEVLGMAENFARKSPSFRLRLEKDIAKLNELIAKEKKDESYLTFGKTKFEITREGIRYGEKFIKAADAETLRWGIAITNSSSYKTYEFKIVVGGSGSYTINVSWKSSSDIKKQEELFQKCVDAIFAYLLPNVAERLRAELARGKTVYVGGIPVTEGGVTLKAQGWFSSKEVFCPWRSLSSEIKNGSAVITSTINSKAEASLSLADIDNAWILCILIKQGMMK